jgi:hypothetical protein
MEMDPRKGQVAKIVCDEFTVTRRGTTRHPLILAVKDSFVLDQMVTQSLLREEENRTLYFPTLGSFALLPDNDPKFLAAKTGTIQVLRTLRTLYEAGESHANLESGQLQDAARDLLGPIDRTIFNLGLYLVDFPGLGAVQGYARLDDHLEFRFLTVSERIMMVDDPESTWKNCVDICRQTARDSQIPQQPVQADRMQNPRTANPQRVKQKGWIPADWILGKPIGEGGQGWTYKVRRKSDEYGDWFVFKRLKNAERADRFVSEIKALHALDHPGILKIVDDGIAEGNPYYIAEYCRNGDLARRNLKGTTTQEKLLLFRQICVAVAAAHTAKIVHRDIKPSNLLVRGDGSIAVGDFGLCLHLGAEDRPTLTEEAVGARNYMAPELEDGRRDDVTPAADVYSLGKILYFLFSGRSFSREKHREPGFDLTHPADGQPEKGIQLVYEILDKSVVERPASRFEDATALNAAVDAVIRRIALNAHILDLGVKQPCLYCVDGEYQQMQGSQTDQHRMILVCRRCGNIQNFGAPFNGWGAWWMRQ